jgi:hypothetical protein
MNYSLYISITPPPSLSLSQRFSHLRNQVWPSTAVYLPERRLAQHRLVSSPWTQQVRSKISHVGKMTELPEVSYI